MSESVVVVEGLMPTSVVEVPEENVILIETQPETVVVEVGIMGPQGPQGEPGPASGSSFQYVHDQMVPDDVWDITHGLNGFPNLTVVDSSGRVVVGDVEYLGLNDLRITFSSGFAGKAYLS